MAAWQLQEAKNKLSELIDRALADFLIRSPLRNSGLVIERDPDAGFPARPDQPV